MLLSHRKRFIYLKTLKTAGTSVEIALESECYPEGEYRVAVHHTYGEIITPCGIVGMRGGDTSNARWFNHMSAAQVRAQAPEEWAKYLKFCVVRNPFDKVVSYFWFSVEEQLRVALASAPFEEVRQRFQREVGGGNVGMDRDKYVIDGALCVDRVLRYESLQDDFRAICAELDISPRSLGDFKRGYRVRPEPFAAYYDERSAAKIAQCFDWETKNFGYTLS